MKRPRDSQRSKAYAAERSLPWIVNDTVGDGSMHAVNHFVDEVWRWCWKRGLARVEEAPRIKDGRGTRIARGGPRALNLPKWARTYTVVLHEIAHALQPPNSAAHGREWARLFAQLMDRWHPKRKEAGRMLRQAYREHGVKFRQSPTLSPERKEELRERGKTLAKGRVEDPEEDAWQRR